MIEKYKIDLRANGKRKLGKGALEICGKKYDCNLFSNNQVLADSLYNEYLLSCSKEIIRKLSPLAGGKVVKALELKVGLED